VLATYLSLLAVGGASLVIGQAALAACGRREWSWLSPAVGLALVIALCWGTVRLPGHGTVSALAVPALTAASLQFLRGRVSGVGDAVRQGLPVVALALIAASLPFAVEGRFGILGTSFNPDMSQHLLAADQLAQGADSQLLDQGYPLGPHSVVVALNKGLGVGLVQGFDGLTVAVAVLASLTALAALGGLGPVRRTVGALLIGIPYMVASYLAQGAFKETIEALFVLAFAIGLWQLSGRGGATESSDRGPLRAVPLAVLAAGSVWAYSFTGLIWQLGAFGLWGLAELLIARPAVAAALRRAVRPCLLALLVFAVLAAPEVGRMIEFGGFETFDPTGPGLGNLFGQISPAEALGVWPSGDFRLSPGDGKVPAAGFYLGVALALVLLAYGLVWSLRRTETALPAVLAAAAGVYAAARIGGTPYTAAKAVQMAAPLAMLAIVRPLLAYEPASLRPGTVAGVVRPALAAAFVVAAGGCSLLALANGPVGPTSYSPALASLRGEIAGSATLALAPADLLREQHGIPYVAWELRGRRVCIQSADLPKGSLPPRGVIFVISWPGSGGRPLLTGLALERRVDGYRLWRLPGAKRQPSSCPLIAVRQARQGEKQGG
jgi:hypothetical protein